MTAMAKLNFIVLVLISVTIVAAVRLNNVEESVNHALENNPLLYSLGLIEGKAILMDNSTQRTWGQAMEFCDKSGMSLARISTAGQHDFLTSKYSLLGLGRWYWTSGRVRTNTDEAYAWDNDGHVPVKSFGNSITSFGIPAALAFHTMSSTSGRLYALTTSDTHFVLCEIA